MLGFVLPLFAEETDSAYFIKSIDFNIKGITRPFAIIRNGELKVGETFDSEKKLNEYIADKTQFLLNNRVFKSVRIEHTIGEELIDAKYPVDLLIIVEDTWNIIALPQPEYSSNTGFELKLKARDYNFLGAMNPLRLDIGYTYDENEHHSLLIDLESDTPFRLFGYNWNFTFNHYFSYRPQVEEPFYYKNVTGLSMELPFRNTTFTFGFTESVLLNEENANRYVKEYGQFQNGVYMSSRVFSSWKIPTGLNIGDYGELTYRPELSLTVNHEFEQWPLADFREGPIPRFYHSLGFKRVDWIENFRYGLDVYFTNTYSYNFYKMRQNEKALNFNYAVSGKGHYILSDRFGVSTFLQFRHWFWHDPNYNDTAGDALRGIWDKAVHADYMLSLNLDFPVKVLDFVPSQWFKTPKLRFFDLEFHVSPIIDMALYHDPENDIQFNFQNILVSGGMEFIVFSDFMRSLYLRVSIAWNIRKQINEPGEYYLNPVLPILPQLPEGKDREIFIGIGHHY